YNAQSIVKLQYQKNFSSSAYMRLYGYTYYSNWLENGPMLSLQPYAYYDSGDYEINNHTRGVSLSFTDQLSTQHLLSAEASYTTASGARIYNEQMFNYANDFAVLVNPNAVNSGTCYIAPSSGKGAATPTTCSDFGATGVTYGSTCYASGGSCQATFATLAGIYNANHGYYPSSLPPPAGSMTCGGVKCAYYVAENGAYGLDNTVTPAFTGYSVTDQWRPGDRWNVNLGVRVDNYSFVGSNTNTGAARNFWFSAFNQDTCYDTATLTLVDRTALLGANSSGQYPGWSTNSQIPCSKFGKQYVDAALSNSSASQDYNIVQPRIGATYTVDPNTVLRASWGKYNEQPSSAYEQYNALQQNLPDALSQFYSLGFTTPGHAVAPSISFNTDFSLEQRLQGTDVSYKLSPFLRQTQNQIENFYINYATGLTSGLNAGKQTSSGFEFQLNKGDFARNGFAAQLSFAYTYATVKYNVLPNGTTIVSPINAGISQYNAYTKGCGPNGADRGKKEFGVPICGSTSTGVAASPCYTAANATPSGYSGGGTPAPCGPGTVANPYWNSPTFGLFDPGAAYLPYSTFPGPIGSGVSAYNYPYVATLVLNYKHNRLDITPSVQFQAGNRYGTPLTMPGIDPALGCGVVSGRVAGDPRYPYGAPGGRPFNGNSCGGTNLSIPDPYTGTFDGIGAFRQPAQLTAHLRVSYDVSPRVSVALTLTNLIATCFGGQTTGFTYFWNSGICAYGNLAGGPSSPPVGNEYNLPSAGKSYRGPVQQFLRYPYEPVFGAYNDLASSLNQPINAYINVKVKI
ncbi:MAG: TonB-dependent receptor, partial [Candidatus Eremiobacteraeota bacterium]|nr:TonB-dependent receptor [Candidatus Eremiobacteraeota bacterium]